MKSVKRYLLKSFSEGCQPSRKKRNYCKVWVLGYEGLLGGTGGCAGVQETGGLGWHVGVSGNMDGYGWGSEGYRRAIGGLWGSGGREGV